MDRFRMLDRSRMKELRSWIPVVTFLLAFLFFYAADELSTPWLSFAGVFFIGLTALAGGLGSVLTGQSYSLPLSDGALSRQGRAITGKAAYLWGAFFVTTGLLTMLAAAAALLAPHSAQAVVDHAFVTPLGWGVLSAGLGVILSLGGLTRIVTGIALPGESAWNRIREISYRMVGAAYLLVGMGLTLLGLLLVYAPEWVTFVFNRWLGQLLGPG
jgi:hypothetical protein